MSPATKQLELTIDGMTCQHCVMSVERALDGVASVEVDEVTIGRASLRYDPETTGREAIREAIRAAGYRVRDGQDDS